MALKGLFSNIPSVISVIDYQENDFSLKIRHRKGNESSPDPRTASSRPCKISDVGQQEVPHLLCEIASGGRLGRLQLLFPWLGMKTFLETHRRSNQLIDQARS